MFSKVNSSPDKEGQISLRVRVFSHLIYLTHYGKWEVLCRETATPIAEIIDSKEYQPPLRAADVTGQYLAEQQIKLVASLSLTQDSLAVTFRHG